mgnify:CR=1 FL=1
MAGDRVDHAARRDSDKPAQRTYDDVYQLLLDRGLTEDAVFRLLRDYPLDKTFTDSEIELLLRQVRPEDLLTRLERLFGDRVATLA